MFRFRLSLRTFLKCIAVAFIVMGLLISVYFLSYHPFKAQVQYVPIQGGKIAYYIRGEGNPLILIEGFGMSMEDWDPALLRDLAKDHQVIVFDLRGVGLSTGSTKNLTVEELSEDTITLCNSLGIKRVSVLGWSMGSLVAQEVAITYPERVDKLILVSTFTNDEHTIDALAATSEYVQNNLGNSWEELFGPVLFTPDKEGTQHREAYFRRRGEAIRSGESPQTPGESVTTKIAQEEAMAKMKMSGSRSSSLSKIKVPTLIIVGDSDQLLPNTNSETVAKVIPNSHLMIVTHAGHAVLFQNSDSVNQAISNFLKTR